MIEWVDLNFVSWGQHVRGGVNLGFHSCSVEARLKDGVLSIGSLRSIPLIFFPQDVELTEQVILRMPDHLINVALAAYTTQDDMTREEQARILTKRLGRTVSKRTLQLWIDALHNQYEGYYRGMLDMLGEKSLTSCAR